MRRKRELTHALEMDILYIYTKMFARTNIDLLILIVFSCFYISTASAALHVEKPPSALGTKHVEHLVNVLSLSSAKSIYGYRSGEGDDDDDDDACL